MNSDERLFRRFEAAIAASDIAAIRRLLSQELPRAISTEDWTVLSIAAADSPPAVVAELLSAGLDPDEVGRRRVTALEVAASQGRARVVELLLKAGANPDVADPDGKTPLHSCLMAYEPGARESVARLLLRWECSPNRPDNEGRTPLHVLCRECRQEEDVDLARILIEGGADPNLRTLEGFSALDLALAGAGPGALTIGEMGHGPRRSLVEILQGVGAEQFRTDDLVGAWAVDSGDIERVRELLDQGWRATHRVNGWTPVYHAIRTRQDSIARELIEWGVDVNSLSEDSETPLGEAVGLGNVALVSLLLDRGADANLGRPNRLPLDRARGNEEISRLLMEHGARRTHLGDLRGGLSFDADAELIEIRAPFAQVLEQVEGELGTGESSRLLGAGRKLKALPAKSLLAIQLVGNPWTLIYRFSGGQPVRETLARLAVGLSGSLETDSILYESDDTAAYSAFAHYRRGELQRALLANGGEAPLLTGGLYRELAPGRNTRFVEYPKPEAGGPSVSPPGTSLELTIDRFVRELDAWIPPWEEKVMNAKSVGKGRLLPRVSNEELAGIEVIDLGAA